jgi:hypothetical protein
MADLNLPIICNLSEEDLKARRRDVLDCVKTAALGARSLPDGLAYEFKFDPQTLAALARLVALEHDCCRFLKFNLVVEPGDGPLSLEVTGPPAAKALIADFLGEAAEPQ